MEHQALEPAIPNTATQAEVVSSILPGLLSCPKYVPHWYVYDKVGSELFDRNTEENPHYHLCRVEDMLLKNHAESIISSFDATSAFVELGAGNSSKTQTLINAMLTKENSLRFVPIDISKDFLENSARVLKEKFPAMDIQPFVGDYVEGIKHAQSFQGPKLFIFLGSSFSNIPMAQMLPFLETVRNSMTGGQDRFLIGLDITRDPSTVEKMYAHSLFADFNRNVLTRLNRDFKANFDQKKFDHYANYHTSSGEHANGTLMENAEYIELGFRSKRQQTVTFEAIGTEIEFQQEEIFYTHVPGNMSMKWNWGQFEKLASMAGLKTEKKWTDDNNRFALGLLKLD